MFQTTNQLKIIYPMSIHMFVVHPSDFSYLKATLVVVSPSFISTCKDLAGALA